METERRITEDGLERTVSVNYVAPYLLTRKLLPSDGRRKPYREYGVLYLCYRTSRFSGLLPPRQERGLLAIPIYSNTKLALTLFTINLAARIRERGIVVNAADPGVVSTNIITMHMWFDPLTDIFFRPFIRTPKQGAATAIHLLLDEDAGKRTGTLNVNCHSKRLFGEIYRSCADAGGCGTGRKRFVEKMVVTKKSGS